MRHRSQRRGVMLALVVIVMGIVAGLFAVLGANLSHYHRQRQADHVRLVSGALAESGGAYARAQMPKWSTSMPTSPIELDVSELLPANMTGAVRITCGSDKSGRRCRIAAHASSGRYASTREIELSLPASRPAE